MSLVFHVVHSLPRFHGHKFTMVQKARWPRPRPEHKIWRGQSCIFLQKRDTILHDLIKEKGACLCCTSSACPDRLEADGIGSGLKGGYKVICDWDLCRTPTQFCPHRLTCSHPFPLPVIGNDPYDFDSPLCPSAFWMIKYSRAPNETTV
jgi:hypothetical protein